MKWTEPEIGVDITRAEMGWTSLNVSVVVRRMADVTKTKEGLRGYDGTESREEARVIESDDGRRKRSECVCVCVECTSTYSEKRLH